MGLRYYGVSCFNSVVFMKKFLLSLLVALSLFQAFMPMAQARGWGPRVEVFEIRETYHYHNGPRTQVIYWGQSTFYYDPSIGLYANHYTQQTIRDFVSLCAYNGLRTVHLIPLSS